jgi:uncharacterized membrane protein YfcA
MPDLLAAVFPSVEAFVLACLLLALAELVYVLLGFGAGLIAVGTLALFLPDVTDVVVMLLLVNLPAETAIVHRSWRQIRWGGVAVLLAGIAVGIPIGGWILMAAEPHYLLTALGVVLIGVGLVFLMLPNHPNLATPRWLEGPIGLISGLLTGLFGTGGPPLVLHFQLQGLDKSAFRGHLMTLFLAMSVVRIPAYVGLGLVTAERLAAGAAVLPAVLLGAVVGHRIHLELDERLFRRLVSGALAVIGAVLLLR